MIRSTRPTAAALLTVLVAVLATLVACGDRDGRDVSATTAGGSSTTAPTDPVMFDATLTRLTGEVEQAADLCGVMTALGGASAAGNPTTVAQAQSAIRFLATAYARLADLAPDSRAEEADVIRNGAAAMLTQAADPDLDVKRLTRDGPTAFDDAFVDALSALVAEIPPDCAGG